MAPTLRVMRLYPQRLGGDNSSVLQLPDNFGSIHIGETFTAVVSALNHSGAPLHDVVASVQLQSSAAKPPAELYHSGTAGQTLAYMPSGASLIFVVSQPMRELGTHTLRVLLTYHAAAPIADADPSTPTPDTVDTGERLQSIGPRGPGAVYLFKL